MDCIALDPLDGFVTQREGGTMQGDQSERAIRPEGGEGSAAGGEGGAARKAPTIGDLLVAEYGALVTYSRRLTANGPEARDLVQMLCARVLSRGGPPERLENASAWLRTALFRLFIDSRRRARREIRTHRAVSEGPVLEIEPDVRRLAVTQEDVRSLLTELPAHYRIPYEMFSFEGMSYEQISSRLGLPCRTVGTRINRARERLRRLLTAAVET
jgi:RNA polymerase sigma-70 factor (ECF subfamily)